MHVCVFAWLCVCQVRLEAKLCLFLEDRGMSETDLENKEKTEM